ncbi:EndoU domain-containing protein [Trinickia dabaoshanensis]|nr:EndoU domain-containing protein [Trinickia dabaoshanensis]
MVTHTQQRDSANPAVVDTATGYVWWDQAEQSTIQVRGTDATNPSSWRWGTGLSDFRYDGNRIGDVSNDGPSAVSYAEELAQADKQKGYGQFRYGHPVTSADFDQNYEPINAEYPGKTPTRYTVQDGDTLNSIARALWGDASLWYVIADANGLSRESHLSAGQILSIPNKVANFHNNASTFKVYNAGEAIGDAMPTLPTEPLPPPPPEHQGACGGYDEVLAMVVAIVVTYVTDGLAAPYMSPMMAGATAGAAGAAASQGVLIASGDQHGFQWTGVVIGAIGGAVGAGVGEYGPSLQGVDDLSRFARGVAQAALSNSISQGVDVATGLQHHFDWRGLAASAIAGGVNNEVSQTSIGKNPEFGRIVSGVVSQTAGATVLGGSMRDRLPRMIGSIAGNTIGSELEEQMQSQSQSTGTSALYGPRGNVDDLVAQSGYAPDPGKQFAWSANAGMGWDNGGATVGSPYSPDVNGYAVPYPAIAVSALPEQMGSMGVQTAAVADGLEAGAGYSFYPVGADGIVHMPTIVVRPTPEMGTVSALSGFKAFEAFNPVGQALSGGIDRLSDMAAGVWHVVSHPFDTAEAIGAHYANAYDAGQLGDTILSDVGNAVTGAVRSSPLGVLNALYRQDEAGAAYRFGGSVVDTAMSAAPSAAGPMLDAGKVGLTALGRWVAPMARDAIESHLQRTGGILFAMPRGMGISAVGVDGATESGRTVTPYSGDPLSPDFVGPLDLNTQATRDVGNVTAPIDFDGHILSGEVKANGSVVGGHSTASGNVQIIPGTESAPNAQGVYKAQIAVPDPANPGQWLPKTNNGGVSTLFPDSWTADRIKVEVDAAYQNRVITGNKWTGITPSGVRVQGWLMPKTTVYPIF